MEPRGVVTNTGQDKLGTKQAGMATGATGWDQEIIP